MDREKQTEEMAKVIDKSPWKLEQDFTGCNINSSDIAESLYNAGYRKQSEVAREIFEEIEGALLNNHCLDEWSDCPTPHYYEELKDDIAELKKKYSEEPVND